VAQLRLFFLFGKSFKKKEAVGYSENLKDFHVQKNSEGILSVIGRKKTEN